MRILRMLAVVVLVACVSCGGSSGPTGPTSTPAITSLAPTAAEAGGAEFTLVVVGRGFDSTSVVEWNGRPHTTTYVSAEMLTTVIVASDIARAGQTPVTVSNAGATSAAVEFTVGVAPPTIHQLSPEAVTAGSSDFVLTVTGTNFDSNPVVKWDGGVRSTSQVAATTLTAQLSAADVATAGVHSLTVTSGSISSAVADFAVTARPSIANSIDAVALQMNPAHTGVVSFASIALPTSSSWTAALDGPPSYAVIADGLVIVTVGAPGTSELVAFDQETGSKVWGPKAIAGSASAAYENGKVFVLSAPFASAATVLSFDARTGTPGWSAVLAGQWMFSSPPTAAAGIVYAQGSGGGTTIYAIDESTGALAWMQMTMAGGWGTVAVGSNGLYESQPCLTYAFDPLSGAPLWYHDDGCDGGGGATPVVANGLIYSPDSVAGYGGGIYDVITGASRGTFAADVMPAIDANASYVLQSHTLRAIDSSSTILWSFAGDGALVTAPVVVNNYVFVGSSSGNVYALDTATGAQVWTKTLPYPIPASSASSSVPCPGLSAGDGLLIVPAGNTLTAFRLSANP